MAPATSRAANSTRQSADYAAYFVNVSGNNLTPVLISALTADYVNTGVDTGSGVFHPTLNYGTDSQFQYATGNFINGSFLSAFSCAGDANFTASMTTVPEPSTCALLGLGAGHDSECVAPEGQITSLR